MNNLFYKNGSSRVEFESLREKEKKLAEIGLS